MAWVYVVFKYEYSIYENVNRELEKRLKDVKICGVYDEKKMAEEIVEQGYGDKVIAAPFLMTYVTDPASYKPILRATTKEFLEGFPNDVRFL